MPGKRFIIIGPQRSGTTLVHLGIRGHPNVCATNDEVRIVPLFTDGIAQFMVSGREFMTELERETRIRACFDAVAGAHRSDAVAAWGMKLASDDYREVEQLVETLRAEMPDAVVIIVERSDLVAQFASGLRMRATGHAHSWRAPKDANSYLVKIQPGRFARFARNVLRIQAVLRQLGTTHETVIVSYERDILPGDLRFFDRIFDVLGVPRMPVDWLDSAKVAPPPGSYIANYEQLSTMLEEIRLSAGHSRRHRWMLRVEDRVRQMKRVGAAVRAALV